MSGLLALQRRFAAALGQNPAAAADDLAPDAARGIAVHRGTIAAGLSLAVTRVFPVTRRIVGAAAFADLAADFAARHPPRAPVLSAYGADFPAFLAALPALAALPYLPDTARLEWLRQEAYMAADAPLLDARALDTGDPEAVSALRLAPHPATRIAGSPFPIHRIWRVNQPDVADVPPVDMSVAEHAAITRPGMEVLTRAIAPADAALVRALAAGETLGDAAAAALAVDGGFDLTAALAAHFAHGTFRAPTA